MRNIKSPAQEHAKNASKTLRGKKPVATRVKKIKIQSCFPFAIAIRITSFSTLWSCNPETNNTEAGTTHIVCQVIRFIPPVFQIIYQLQTITMDYRCQRLLPPNKKKQSQAQM